MSLIPKTFLASAVLLGLSASSVLAQSKVGTINIQQAIVSTKDGQKASAELQTRFDPKRKEIEKNNVAKGRQPATSRFRPSASRKPKIAMPASSEAHRRRAG